MFKKLSGFFLFIYIIIYLFSCQQEANNYVHYEINENWSFRKVGDTIWHRAVVPGCIHTDLMNNGIIEDPFFRLNEKDIQWIDKKDWEYQTSFHVDQKTLKKDVVELIFNGLDTYADIYLNDNFILSTDNMFISWTVNCKHLLKTGKNTLKIIFRSPVNIGLEKRSRLGYQLPGAENDQSELGGLGNKKVCVFSRKAQYHFGWDWGPRLVTSGIWQTIELKAWNKAKLLDINIIQKQITDKEASLIANLEIEALENIETDIHCIVDSNELKKQTISLKKGTNKIDIAFNIENPELWWTNSLGKQRLYCIHFDLYTGKKLIASKSKNIGLRTLKVIQEPDSTGKNFYFELNGHPVFMKGANYIPQDIFLSRVSNSDYEYLIKSAAEANFNMLRVWGGGIYEKDIFYDLCDKYGILVWQDFMFACAMYPGNQEFLDNVEKEAGFNIKRLRNHACITLWCGDNEILSAWNRWGWKDSVLEKQGQAIVDTIWNAYNNIFHNILPRAVKELDPEKLYWSSSPSSGFGELENGKSGDNHYWGVWWAKEPFSKYEEEIPRFMSEFGFQSFPEFNSVKKYTTEEDWDIYSEVMKSHQRSSIGNATIEEYMLRDFKKPENFESFLYVGQLLQSRGIKTGIEAHRRNMPYCMGSLYWQFNDCWPVASWSGIDYYGKWKAMHYMVRDAFKNTIISFEKKDGILNVYIISDKLKDQNARLKITVLDFYGRVIHSIEKNMIITKAASKIYYSELINKLLSTDNKNKVLINAAIIDDENNTIDNSIYYPALPKDLILPEPMLKYEISELEKHKYSINISTDVLAKNVYFQCDDIEGHFSHNYFDLLPKSSKKVLFITKDQTNLNHIQNNLKIITLNDCYK